MLSPVSCTPSAQQRQNMLRNAGPLSIKQDSPVRMFSEGDRYPAGLLNAQSLLNKAAEAAADLELQLPPLNAPLVLQRSLIELGMPQVQVLAPQLNQLNCSCHLAADCFNHALVLLVMLHARGC